MASGRALADHVRRIVTHFVRRTPPHLVFAITDLRNAVAHNGVVFDTITDYLVLVVYLSAGLGFPRREVYGALRAYAALTDELRSREDLGGRFERLFRGRWHAEKFPQLPTSVAHLVQRKRLTRFGVMSWQRAGCSSSLCGEAAFAKLRHIMDVTHGHGSPEQDAILYRIAY